MKKLIFIFLIFSSTFFFSLKVFATNDTGNKEWVEEFLTTLKKEWEERTLPVFKKMWKWFEENIWTKIISSLKAEYEKRKPEVREEFEKKREEIKKEIPQFLEKIWNKIYSSLRK